MSALAVSMVWMKWITAEVSIGLWCRGSDGDTFVFGEEVGGYGFADGGRAAAEDDAEGGWEGWHVGVLVVRSIGWYVESRRCGWVR
jgi:hypothetical protein